MCANSQEPSRASSFADLFTERIFVSIVVFADESGMHDPTGMHHGSDVATVCGYLSHKEQWKNFDDDWQGVLDSKGIRVFHMSEFMDKINGPSKPDWPYRGWSDSERDSFIRALIAVARNYMICGVGGVLNVRDYERVTPAWLKADMEHPYSFCCQVFLDCLVPVFEQLEPPLLPEDRAAFFFDQGNQFKPMAIDSFDVLKALRDSPQSVRCYIIC